MTTSSKRLPLCRWLKLSVLAALIPRVFLLNAVIGRLGSASIASDRVFLATTWERCGRESALGGAKTSAGRDGGAAVETGAATETCSGNGSGDGWVTGGAD